MPEQYHILHYHVNFSDIAIWDLLSTSLLTQFEPLRLHRNCLVSTTFSYQ